MPSQAPADPNLARVLRAARGEQGRSQEGLAHDSNITVAALARIERGQANPAWTTVMRIIGALGISSSELARRLDG
jgi:transcriptional regulator with XRE-family HTH domain